MQYPRIRTLFAGLLALAHLLAPFAHLPARAVAPGWTEICTAEGVRRIASDDDPAAPLHGDDHCALCRIASPMAGVAPAVPAPARPELIRAPAAAAGADLVARPLPRAAPARAPPFSA